MTAAGHEVVVVGLGAWGSAALWRLARRGVRVLGLEQFGLGHARGSSYGGSRMFRTVCLEHPGLVPLARRSLELWQELAATDPGLLRLGGGVLIGPPEGRIVGGALAAVAEHDLPAEVLDAAELVRRMPGHAGLPAGHVGVWDPTGALIHPERAIRSMCRLAQAAGAQVRTGVRVHGIEPVGDGVVVRTGTGEHRAAQVVVTAGGWLGKLLPDLPVQTIRMPMTWFRPAENAARFDLARLPVFMREIDDRICVWGHGSDRGGEVKIGLEDGGGFASMDPDTSVRRVVPADWQPLTTVLRSAVPGLEPAPSTASICMYTCTPDGQFLLGRPGGDHRLVIGGGCNGHGFKHATGIGEILADLVQGRPAGPPFTNPNRFSGKAAV